MKGKKGKRALFSVPILALSFTLAAGLFGNGNNANGIDQPELWTVEYRYGAPPPGYSFTNWPLFESWLEVRIENMGPGDAFNVTATIMSQPANVTIVDGDVTIGDIPAGGSAWSAGDTFTLIVDMSNPQDPGEGIYWRIEYDDSRGTHHVVEGVPEFPSGPG